MKFQSEKLFSLLLSATVLTACSSSGSDNTNENPTLGDEVASRAMTQNASLSGAIQTQRDVDWYTINAKQGDIVSVRVSNNTHRADVDLLLTVYEKDANGDLQRLFADHATESSSLPAKVVANVYANSDKTLYVSVRDLNDDEASVSEVYTIEYDIAKPEDGNSSFDDAQSITVDGDCETDNIGNVGDVDVYSFTLAASQIIEVNAEFKPFGGGSPVKPNLSLYDSLGNLIQSQSQSDNSIYRVVEAIPAGRYFAVIKDQGADDFDSASSITTCVSKLTGREVAENDSKATATILASNTRHKISGSLDYSRDEDWSAIEIAPLQASQVRVLSIEFDPSLSAGCQGWFLVEVSDANGKVIFSKEYSSELLPTTLHVRTNVAGQHHVRVTTVDNQVCSINGATGSPYSIDIVESDVDDLPELTLDGNDSESSADIIDPSINQTLNGKISYMGDVDWYSVQVPNDSEHRVLELFFNGAEQSPVDYHILVKKDGATVASYIGNSETEAAPEFKTSFLIPAAIGTSNREYQIKISDVRSDESDMTDDYTLRANLLSVPTATPNVPTNSHGILDSHYLSEALEQDQLALDTDNSINLSVYGKKWLGAYDNSVMVENIADHTTLDSNANTISLTFPWLSGYIDFDGDRDWARLDLNQIYSDAGGSDENWYADISVELYSAGSNVEYAWALYRDEGDNGSLREGKANKDGYFALVGDTLPDTTEYYRATPDNSESLWVNKRYVNGAPFYLSLSDVRASEAGNHAKNDWGYDSAYFVRVKLVFHSGKERPTSN